MTAKNIPKVLDNGYLEKLLSGVKEPAQRDLLEKQLNISVNTFLGFCHAREDHPNFKDGTVNNVEFDGLKG